MGGIGYEIRLRVGLLLAADSLHIEQEWTETFFDLDNGQRFVLLILGVVCATGIIISTVGMVITWAKIFSRHRNPLETRTSRSPAA